MVVGRHVGLLHEVDSSWVDDDKVGTLADAALHVRREHRVRVRGVGADDH
jgi:hypothetical protein